MENSGSLKHFTLLLAALWAVSAIMGCATTPTDSLEARLARMSDEELVSYYHGINDRLKEIQAGTRSSDRQGAIQQEDQLAKMPYIIGGEAWELEKKRKHAHKEMVRRNLRP